MVQKAKHLMNPDNDVLTLVLIIIGIGWIISILTIGILTFMSRTIPNSIENISLQSLVGLLGLLGIKQKTS